MGSLAGCESRASAILMVILWRVRIVPRSSEWSAGDIADLYHREGIVRGMSTMPPIHRLLVQIVDGPRAGEQLWIPKEDLEEADEQRGSQASDRD